MIQVRLCGAAGEVTGSGYLVETPDARVLVDFGIFQGGRGDRERSRSLGPVDPGKLDAVVLTHAHLDHSGRLPLLYAAGYQGKLYATHGTLDTTMILLEDMARIEEESLKRENRKRRRAGDPIIEAVYSIQDVERIRSKHRLLHYNQPKTVAPGVEVRLFEAGHILGSTSVELSIEHKGEKRVLVFSGDVGPCAAPILRDPERPTRGDLVFLESTYGGRERPPREETVSQFKALLKEAWDKKERIIIPAFAVGRTQVILYYIAEAVREGVIPKEFPIYLDSPMAAKATQVVIKHPELYDEELTDLAQHQQLQQDLEGLTVIETVDESIELNYSEHACVIMSASGMCEGGRVIHHLRHNLWRENANVMLVGYMAEGTLGRKLAEGEKRVEIFGEPIAVKARIHMVDGFSAHAGHSELLDWLKDVAPSNPQLVLTHGEDEAREALAAAVHERYGIDAICPQIDEVIELD